MNTVILSIEGMTCGSCERRVARALQQVEGVETVSVSRAQRRAVVDGQADVEQLAAAVRSAGYQAAQGHSEGAPGSGRSGGRCCC